VGRTFPHGSMGVAGVACLLRASLYALSVSIRLLYSSTARRWAASCFSVSVFTFSPGAAWEKATPESNMSVSVDTAIVFMALPHYSGSIALPPLSLSRPSLTQIIFRPEGGGQLGRRTRIPAAIGKVCGVFRSSVECPTECRLLAHSGHSATAVESRFRR